ncbi:MAG: ABC transporter permease [Halobacteriaceae archaeon]
MSSEGRLQSLLARVVSRDTVLTVVAALIAASMLVPLAWLFVDARDIGARAFELLLAPTTLRVLGRSVALVAVVTAATVVLGVSLAVLTVQTDLPFRRFWTVVTALPLVIPSYLGAFAALSAFGRGGLLSELLGTTVPPLTGFTGTAVVMTLYTYPYVYLTTRASLLSLDASLVRAARSLDATRREAFRRVTLPQITPGIAAGALLVALYTLSDFGTPNFMRLQVFTQFIYARYVHATDYAVVLSLELIAVTAGIILLQSRIGADRSGAYASGGQRGATKLSLGKWRYPAMALPAAVATAALVAPLTIFCLLLFREDAGYVSEPSFAWSYAVDSVTVSLLAAVAAVLVALPIALQAAQSDSRLAWLADRAAYVGFAVPGIVLGIALVSFGLDVLPWLHKTLPILIFAYVVRFMPQALGSIRTSILQVDRNLVAAARTLGKSPAAAFRSVTLPLIAPGMATGAALVFLTTMKELPATLILQPYGFKTLVLYIWEVREAGLYGRAAVPALVLVFVSALSMAVILLSETSGDTGGK